MAGRWLVVSVRLSGPGVVAAPATSPHTFPAPMLLAAANAEDTRSAAATMTTWTASLRAIRA